MFTFVHSNTIHVHFVHFSWKKRCRHPVFYFKVEAIVEPEPEKVPTAASLKKVSNTKVAVKDLTKNTIKSEEKPKRRQRIAVSERYIVIVFVAICCTKSSLKIYILFLINFNTAFKRF